MTGQDEIEAQGLVAALLATKRPPAVEWRCAAGTTQGRGGCRLLLAWHVPTDLGAVVWLPASRVDDGHRAGVDLVRPAVALPLDRFRTYFRVLLTDPPNPGPQLACDHYRVTRTMAEFDADLAAARGRGTVRRRLGESTEGRDDRVIADVQRRARGVR